MEKYRLMVVKTPTNSKEWKIIAKKYPWTVMKKFIGKDVRLSFGSFVTKEQALKAKNSIN